MTESMICDCSLLYVIRTSHVSQTLLDARNPCVSLLLQAIKIRFQSPEILSVSSVPFINGSTHQVIPCSAGSRLCHATTESLCIPDLFLLVADISIHAVAGTTGCGPCPPALFPCCISRSKQLLPHPAALLLDCNVHASIGAFPTRSRMEA